MTANCWMNVHNGIVIVQKMLLLFSIEINANSAQQMIDNKLHLSIHSLVNVSTLRLNLDINSDLNINNMNNSMIRYHALEIHPTNSGTSPMMKMNHKCFQSDKVKTLNSTNILVKQNKY